MTARRGFGNISVLPSGRYRARYRHAGKMWTAGESFPTKTKGRESAEAWLTRERGLIDSGKWTPPGTRPAEGAAAVVTVAEHVARAIKVRAKMKGHSIRHVGESKRLLRTQIEGTPLGKTPLPALTVADVDDWFADLCPGRPAQRAAAYSLLSTSLKYAVKRKLIDASPCQIEGGTKKERASVTRIVTPAELAVIIEHLPERYRVLVAICGWGGLRWGEATELRRRDVIAATSTLKVERGVVRVERDDDGDDVERDARGRRKPLGPQEVAHVDPKAGSKRPVIVSSLVMALTVEHLARYVGEGDDALLFPSVTDPSRNLPVSTFRRHWVKATDAAGRPGFRFHDLRHTAGTRFTQGGGTLKEVMTLLGHKTQSAALRYQAAEEDRMRMLAEQAHRPARLTG
jgi:integrase